VNIAGHVPVFVTVIVSYFVEQLHTLTLLYALVSEKSLLAVYVFTWMSARTMFAANANSIMIENNVRNVILAECDFMLLPYSMFFSSLYSSLALIQEGLSE